MLTGYCWIVCLKEYSDSTNQRIDTFMANVTIELNDFKQYIMDILLFFLILVTKTNICIHISLSHTMTVVIV